MTRERPCTRLEWSKLDDEDLMIFYQAGEMQAFEVLYMRYSGRLYAYLLKHKLNPEGAQELLQDIFARLHRYKEQYNPQQPFLPWLFTLTRHLLLDHMKKSETVLTKRSQSLEPHLLENSECRDSNSNGKEDLQLAFAQYLRINKVL